MRAELRSLGLAGAGLAAVFTTGIERPSAQDLRSLQAMHGLSGTCTDLIIAGRATPRCDGKLMNSTFKNGRSSFMVFAGDVAMVAFSGDSRKDVREGDAISQPLDRVTFQLLGAGVAPHILPATGRCRHTNPFIGPATVTCSAQTSAGRFAVTFRTNGERPDSQTFE